MASFPVFLQRNQMDCGPSCLYIISKFYGRNFSIEKLRHLSEIGKEGVSILGISDAAEKIGFKTLSVQLTPEELSNLQLPCILYWNQQHFVVLYKINHRGYHISDPASGLSVLSKKEFNKNWISAVGTVTPGELVEHAGFSELTGIALTLDPPLSFYSNQYDESFASGDSKGFSTITKYLLPYKKLFAQIVVGMLLGSLLQLLLPFLTQSIVDVGVNSGDLHFVYMILLAQLALLAGRLTVDFIRGWILYHVSSRINIRILTDFFIKLMKLPVSYFDSKKTADIMQRMNDHQRIQNFLTGTSLTTLFSIFNLLVFSIVLATFNMAIFLIFLIASILYTLWIIVFLKRRKQLDHRQFSVSSAEQGKTMEIVQGMQEIKLNGFERPKRWQWERLQIRGFKLGLKNLALNQWQQAGAFFINESKNIIITFLAAQAVIHGQMTLGGMLAIQYIIGQLNSPIEQLISFVQSWQLAKISLDRLNEIHGLQDEEPTDIPLNYQLPENKSIQIEYASFTYPGAGNEPVLKNIDLDIFQGKTTAIVGTSGSGKTTLLKLLLKFYELPTGRIDVGKQALSTISHGSWRKQIGVVMQESFIFSDSIAANIAVSDEHADLVQLKQAARTANVLEFIESLPLGFNTQIGAEGIGISAGQKQRILIARAVYKDPEYIFFDEATNSLDANNETIIMKNLKQFFAGKTVVVVAHRLSTVKNADQIVVLDHGIIAESGTHAELTQRKGQYYTLVKNQLELGQ